MLLLAFGLGILYSCQIITYKENMTSNKEALDARIARLGKKYDLRIHCFDAECLYNEGDLAATVLEFLTELLPDEKFSVVELLSPNRQQVIARVSYQGEVIEEVVSNVGGDYLPESFYEALDSIPARAGSKREIWVVNPRLYGQDGCFLSGTAQNLLAARQEGLPLLMPTESIDDMMQADISEFE
jgi:hypothetical protein